MPIKSLLFYRRLWRSAPRAARVASPTVCGAALPARAAAGQSKETLEDRARALLRRAADLESGVARIAQGGGRND